MDAEEYEEWSKKAACREVDPELFFPDAQIGRPSSAGERSMQVRNAKLICKGCNALSQCREYALAREEPHGIWGNMTPRERRFELRRRARLGLRT